MGILGCGYYLHNISLPIIRSARNPENSIRDVILGYFLVYISNSICGTMAYFGFLGSYFKGKPLEQNCINMFSAASVIAIVVRLCVFF